MNYAQYKDSLAPEVAALLPTGTTGNEQLHAELNRWFRGIVQMHKSTLRLKLRIFQTAKLIAHNAALYNETTVQIKQTHLLHRVASEQKVWEDSGPLSWKAFCGEQAIPITAQKKAQRRAQVLRVATVRKSKLKLQSDFALVRRGWRCRLLRRGACFGRPAVRSGRPNRRSAKRGAAPAPARTKIK